MFGTDKKKITIVIVSYNTCALLKKCLSVVRDCLDPVVSEVIIVDNASNDDSVEMLKTDFSDYTLIESSHNLGFAGANNLALREAKGDYCLLLNSDAFIEKETIPNALEYMESHETCGILGVKLIGEKGEWQPSARQFPSPWFKLLTLTGIASRNTKSKLLGGPDYTWWNLDEPRIVDWVPGAFYLVRKKVFDDIGLLDERFFLYYEETDFCLRAKRKGWNTVVFPYVSVIHLGGESSKTLDRPMSNSGKQLIDIRVASEQKYYWKNYGFAKMFIAVLVEQIFMWLVIIKNSIIRKGNFRAKRDNARVVLDCHRDNLRNSKFREEHHG